MVKATKGVVIDKVLISKIIKKKKKAKDPATDRDVIRQNLL
jgi:hypothetical protein